MKKSSASGISDNIPCDEKIGCEIKLMYNLQLLFYTLSGFRIASSVSRFKAVFRQLA
jgi:hypothetical protein